MMSNDLKTAVSLEEWVAKVSTWKTATRELVRLWLINELGCQRELANHLGLSDRAIRKHVAKLREDGELAQVAETDGRAKGQSQKKEPSSYSVEQFSAPVPTAAYPSAVLPTEEPSDAPLTLPTAEELMARVMNLEAENASLRAQLEAQPAVEAPQKGSDVVTLEKKMGRLQKRLKDRDRAIRKLKALVPKSQITNVPLIELEPCEETDEERLRHFSTNLQERQVGWGHDKFVDAECIHEAIISLKGMLVNSLGDYNTEQVRQIAGTLRWTARMVQEDFMDRDMPVVSEGTRPVNYRMLDYSQMEIIDI